MFSLNPSLRSPVSRRGYRPSLMARLQGALSLHRQRNRLAKLDDTQLKDIGITRTQALTESARPFWDAPDHWQG